jgi:NAD(P)H dehydrogenase (quinone)
MATLLITFYSRSGHTAKMAEYVAEGARTVAGVEVQVRPVGEVEPDDLLKVDGVVMGSPVYYGTMAAELKRLIDDSVAHHGRLDGKVGAAFASSGGPGGGNETTIIAILEALLIHGMIVQGDPKGDHYGPISVGAPDERSRDECLRHGHRVAELVKRVAG